MVQYLKCEDLTISKGNKKIHKCTGAGKIKSSYRFA